VAAILTAKDFFLVRHSQIWSAIEYVYAEHRMIESSLVAFRLEQCGQLDSVGGRSYLVQIMTEVPLGSPTAVFAEIVKRLSRRRSGLLALDKIRSLLNDTTLETDDAFSQADKLWMKASGQAQDDRGEWIAATASDYLDELSRRMVTNAEFSGVQTGLRALDVLINGMERGRLHILCGRPGMGKSTIADNIVLNAALKGVPVLHATSERPKAQVFQRWVSILTGISYQRISQAAGLNPAERAKITKAIGDLSTLPIYLYDVAMPTIGGLHRQAQFLQDRHNIQLVVFDGMYRCKTGDKQIDRDDFTRYSMVAESGKTIAGELNLPVLFTHQLNRGLEDRNDKRPRLSDLRGSGRIEEEADIVIGAYRDSAYDPTADSHSMELLVLKNRDGEQSTAHMYYDGSCSRIQDGTAQVHRLNDPF
jgi:replicative DNA helicase